MRTVPGFALAVVLAVAAGGAAEDKDTPIDGKKLIGKWEPKEAKKDGKIVIEFTKDGKLIISAEAAGKTEKYDGTYKVNGNKLGIVMKLKDTEVKEDVTLLRLTDADLETEDVKGKKESWRRLKGDN
ncbi:MAG: hypothetical protein JWO38_2645 [Gemmataceae bacterium]|nr:hypothetical protein [Gemmataceae bacterium]